jgi:hypothetical protein
MSSSDRVAQLYPHAPGFPFRRPVRLAGLRRAQIIEAPIGPLTNSQQHKDHFDIQERSCNLSDVIYEVRRVMFR